MIKKTLLSFFISLLIVVIGVSATVDFKVQMPSTIQQGQTFDIFIILNSDSEDQIRYAEFTLTPRIFGILNIESTAVSSAFTGWTSVYDRESGEGWKFGRTTSGQAIVPSNTEFVVLHANAIETGNTVLDFSNTIARLNPFASNVANNDPNNQLESQRTITVTSCPSGQTLCGTSCVDLNSDSSCGISCGTVVTCDTSTQRCIAGTCSALCGNDVCLGGENVINCPTDCSTRCGDAICEASELTTTPVCESDCSNCVTSGTGNICESRLDCIPTRSGFKCKNLDNGKRLEISDGSLGEIKFLLIGAYSLSSLIPSIAADFRSFLSSSGDSVETVDSCNSCNTDCILKKTGQYLCVDLDGVDSSKELSSTDGALGKIKSILKDDSQPFIKRLALIAKELNLLFT
ncbi:hypothetical protein HYX13_04390 [Candidatus Woesearchaeota archaeon]|nr:hypothetical protein [Candidatus Woesearchaeota archaeon]